MIKHEINEWGTHYQIGSFCRDRKFDSTGPVADCATYITTNALANANRTFESATTGPAVGKRANVSRYTLNLVSDDRLRADSVGYDREGVVEQPVFRCFYDRVN